MPHRNIPGHVSAGELTGDKDAVAVDRIPASRVAQRKLDRGVLAGTVTVFGSPAGDVILRRDHNIAPPGCLRSPDLESRLRPLSGVQGDERRVRTKRVILWR